MRLIILFAAIIAGYSVKTFKTLSTTNHTGQTRYFLFPNDGNDQLYLVDAEESLDVDFLTNVARNPAYNCYWLYTRANPKTAQILILDDVLSVKTSNFDPVKTTVFLAHGWGDNGKTGMSTTLTEAFLQDDDVNVIVLDWSKIAGSLYINAKSAVPSVGHGLGQFVNWLTTLGLQYDRTHLVGFSLGGHLVGHAGRTTGGRVKRLTSLDPAGPLFSDSDRVAKTDAQYVEVIHTGTNMLGYVDPCGDADFYPNGGSAMPGCWITLGCSHRRAWEYMAATIKYNHLIGNECNSVKDASKNRCFGQLVPMGNSDLNKSLAGVFRVNTNANYPY